MKLIVPTTRVLESYDPVWQQLAGTPFNVTLIAGTLVGLGFSNHVSDQDELNSVELPDLMAALMESLGSSVGNHRLPFGNPDFQGASYALWKILLSYRPIILTAAEAAPHQPGTRPFLSNVCFWRWQGKDAVLMAEISAMRMGARFNPKWAE